MLCGQIEKQTGTLEINSLGGLGTRLPRMAFVFGLAGMASIGLPGLANFPGEFMVFFSGSPGSRTASAPWQIATILCLWGLVIGAVYMLRAYRNIFQGDLSKGRRLRDGTAARRTRGQLLPGHHPGRLRLPAGPGSPILLLIIP